MPLLAALLAWLPENQTRPVPPTVDGGREFLIDFLAAVVLCWRWPAATRKAIATLNAGSYTYADLVSAAGLTPAEGVWPGIVTRLLEEYPSVVWGKAALGEPVALEPIPGVAAWSVLKWGGVLLLLVGLGLLIWRKVKR
jgi:hypothetical protein